MTTPNLDKTVISQELFSYLNSRFPSAQGFNEETLLLEGNEVDSLGFLDLMMFLAERFGIVLEDEHFTPENLATPHHLIEFIAKERG